MRYWFLIVFFCSCMFNVIAQEKKSDYRFWEARANRNSKNADSIFFYANKILAKAEKENNSSKIGKAYRFLAEGFFVKNDLLLALDHAKLALKFLGNNVNTIEDKALSHQLIGKINVLNDDVDEAYENFIKAKQLLEKLKKLQNVNTIYLVKNDLAYLYVLTGRHDDALQILNATLKECKSDEVLANTYSIFSIIANYNNDFKESIKYFQLSIPIYERLGRKVAVLVCEMNIAANYYYLKEYKTAVIELQKVLNKTNEVSEQFPIIIRGYLFLAKSYLELQDFSNAKKYLQKTDFFFHEKLLQPDLLLEDLFLITKVDYLIYEGKYDHAKSISLKRVNYKNLDLNSKLEFYKRLKEISIKQNNSNNLKQFSDSIASIETRVNLKTQSNLIDLMSAEFKFNVVQKELELKNKELELLQAKEKNNQIRLFSLFGIIVISGIFVIVLFFRQKKINAMREAILIKEKLYLESVNNKKALEIDFKNKEIVDFALHISEKNEMLSEIKEKLKILTNSEVNVKKEVNELIFFINNTIDQNSEKVQVYSDVKEIKDSFFQQLEFLFPTLTEKEKRVASLVRMQLTSKQIGQQLNITSASVDNYRSILRKKMKLSKEDSLLDYLNRIS